MKYLFGVFITVIFASYSVRAQTPTEIVPEFNFYKPDKTVFTKKDLTNGKYLFFHCCPTKIRNGKIALFS